MEDRYRTLGLVVHPSKPVESSVRTMVDHATAHSVRVVARTADAARVPEAHAVTDVRCRWTSW